MQKPTFNLHLDQTSPSHAVSALNSHRRNSSKKSQSHRGYVPSASDEKSSLQHFAELKEKRKLLESNAQMLSNRLSALSQEEHRLKRNVFDVKKRSQDLLNYKFQREQQKVQDNNAQRERQEIKQTEQEKIRRVVSEARYKTNETSHKTQAMIVEQRKKEAKEIREQKALNEQKIVQARLQHLEKQKLNLVKRKEEEVHSAQKIKEYFDVKADMMKMERENRIKEEEKRILEKEKELQKLCSQEDQLLELVNKADYDNTKALTEYDEIAKLPLDELGKYSTYIKTDRSYGLKNNSIGDFSALGSLTSRSQGNKVVTSPFKPSKPNNKSQASP